MQEGLKQGSLALARWLVIAACLVVAGYVLVRPFTPIWLDAAVAVLAIVILAIAAVRGWRRRSGLAQSESSQSKEIRSG